MKFLISFFIVLLATDSWAGPIFNSGAYSEVRQHIIEADGTITNPSLFKITAMDFDAFKDVYKANFSFVLEDVVHNWPLEMSRAGAEAGVDISNCEVEGGRFETLTVGNQSLITCYIVKQESDRTIEIWLGNVFGGEVKLSVLTFATGRTGIREVVDFKN